MKIYFCAVLGIVLLTAGAYTAAPQTPAKTTKTKKAKSKAAPVSAPPVADTPKGHFLIATVEVPQAADGTSCGGLLPAAENRTLSASEVAGLIGDPAPFSLVARGPRRILIYATHRDLSDSEREIRRYIDDSIRTLAVTGKFDVELKIPNASAFVDVSSAAASLNYADFNVEAVGPDAIRVSSDGIPDCKDWHRFLAGLRAIAWRPYSVQPVDKVFYLDGSAVAAALNAGGGSGGGGDASTPKSATPNITVNAVGTQNATPSPNGSADTSTQADPSASDGTPAPSTAKDKTAGATKPKAAAKTAPAKKTGGKAPATDPTADPAATDPSAAKDPSAAPAKKAATPSPQPAGNATAPAAVSDGLIFSEPTPGDDYAVQEKRRIVSMLDLPRPEMIVNVWSAQISAADPGVVERASRKFREGVSHSNDQLQATVGRGWEALKQYFASDPTRYNALFSDYIALRHVGETHVVQRGPDDGFAANIEDFLNFRTGASLDAVARKRSGACESARYCLGYFELLHPLKPRLMDLLLALTFAEDPVAAMDFGLNAMENGGVPPPVAGTCEAADHLAYGTPGPGTPPFFRCFRQKANLLLAKQGQIPTPIGILRSALADFLFHYKMAMEFPHEFSPYDLDMSAQALNTALAPLIDAFNRDIAVFQSELGNHLMRSDDGPQPGSDWTASDQSRAKFVNNGIITVRTVSGKETVVDTTTQSYLDVTKAPTIPELLSSISAAEGKVPGVIGNNLSASAAAALVGALNTTQSTEAKIGRGIKIDLMPRSLPGASSAEIDVVMNVEETAEPSLYTAGQSSTSNDNLSRVAKHDTTTKMRVDSLRIFEVSSFSAKLLRSRARFPLLPLPGLEVPYIGTLVGIPRKPAAEYHNSVAVLSAIVVPTAADLAYGARFEVDKIVHSAKSGNCAVNGTDLSGCEFMTPHTMADLGNIRAFHAVMMSCLATGSPNPAAWAAEPPEACSKISLSSLPKI